MTDRSAIEEEQAFIDRAHECLDAMRTDANSMLESVLDLGRGGTFQSRTERDIVVRTSLARLAQLDIGDQALCFGRIDHLPDSEHLDGESFHVGRLAVSGPDLEPLVIDWRAPIAEPFYQATGRDSRGLARRRHLHVKGRSILGVEDEYFADAEGNLHLPDGSVEASSSPDGLLDGGKALGGPGALLAAIGQARTGRMGDIVATIQREQDEIIRAPLSGILMVQGGPGTGKTAVALHRAAYLLYTHRFPLERQGVLVVGPNPLFLRYIEQVLPSLGETGVTLSTVAGLVHEIKVTSVDEPAAERVKGDPVMATVMARAVKSRQRSLKATAEIPYGASVLRLTTEESTEIIERARRRPGAHNARRRFVDAEVIRVLARKYQAQRGSDGEEFDLPGFSAALHRTSALQEVLDRMWPRLSPHELVHDLFGARPLLKIAAKGLLDDDEIASLYRPRSSSLEDVAWTAADAAIVDEARVLLGPRRQQPKEKRNTNQNRVEPLHGDLWANVSDGGGAQNFVHGLDDELRSFGHIVVDEIQDLSPMQLRMLQRRSLSASMTVVGDIAQATGPWAPSSWEQVASHLAPSKTPTITELTVSYRTPAEVVELAATVLAIGAPHIEPPKPVRRSGFEPRYIEVPDNELAAATVAAASAEVAAVGDGRVAVLVPRPLLSSIHGAFVDAGVDIVDPRTTGGGGLTAPLVLLAVDEANGLEFDAVVVVEPALIATRSGPLAPAAGESGATTRGLRTLYVALTRPTRRLAIVASRQMAISFERWRTNPDEVDQW